MRHPLVVVGSDLSAGTGLFVRWRVQGMIVVAGTNRRFKCALNDARIRRATFA
jgi:hypothetical protein